MSGSKVFKIKKKGGMNFEVKYLKNGELVIDLQTDDEDKAKYWAKHLRTKGYKQVHIQHSFARGGNIVSSSELEPWATNMSEQNLLRWTGYQSHSDYEHEMDKPFEIKEFIKENQKDLSYIYLNPSKYGLDRDPVYMKEGGAVGYNPEFLKTPILYGKEISLKMPNGESRKAKFAIVDMSNISASHNEKTYSSTTGYPTDSNGENVNDRNYTGDVSSQAKIIEFAQGLEPERLITTSRTPAGTPIISQDGIVVSGNNRTMSLKLAASDYPEKYEEYKEFLTEEFDAFGFGSTDTSDFTNPVLVRIDYDFPAYNALELSKYNKDTKKSERPIDKALKLGKVLASSNKCTSIISDVVGKYETFSEFYSNHADQKTIKNTLIDCNILTTQEIPAYFAETGFTEQGKELIENLLAGLVLSKDALIASNEGGARIFRQTIITSLPILTANKSLPENSLNDAINEALIMQSKMSSSKTSFQDYVAQIGMFGEATSEEGMFLNRLLNSGRNNFKRSIEAYNQSVIDNQGENLWGDKPTKEEIFEAHVKNKIDVKERKVIENTKSNITVIKQTPEQIQELKDNFDKEVEALEPAKNKMLEERKQFEQKPTMKSNPFVNGNFFKEKPDNILAKTQKGSSRYGKEITEYKGSLEDVKRIDAPLDFLAAHEEQNPLLTVIEEPVTSATDTNTSVVINLEKSITKSKKEVAKKVKRKTTDVVPVEELTDSYTVKEVWEMINPEVTVDELRAFMWWKNEKGRPIVSKEWMDLTEMNEDELYRNSGLVQSFVEKGLLYYFDGELLPAYLYLAENVYDKKAKLVKAGENSGQDAKYIIDTYGQEVFDNQVKALEAVFKIQYDKRLMIRTDSEDALIINPVSKFSKEFMIKTFADGNPFKWKKITAGGNKRYGKPDFLISYVADRDKHEFEELSLTDAFCLWLRTDDTIQFKKGMNYADIIKIYVQSGSKPATTAVKNADDQYVGAQLTLKKKEDAEWERLKSKTKDEGDRLFLDFMDKQLTPLDKTTIEMQWNRDFNGYVKINYNKVPVAFPCNKYDMGKPMEIRPEKREAVAFTFSEGSGLLAYDVGVGKASLLTSNILTPKGYVKMGDIKVGDNVIGKNGYPTLVEGVFPQGSRQSYKVTFSDGSFTEVTDEHLWNVQTINYRSKYPEKWDTLMTKDIKENLFNYRGDYQFSIPMVEAIQFDKQDVPMHPYLLGALLGDGCLCGSGIEFCNPEIDIQKKIRSLLPEGSILNEHRNDGLHFRIKVDIGSKNEINESIISLGLKETKANSKFIPDCYKFNTPEIRLEMLRGLIDTDGYLDNRPKSTKGGCLVQYTTVSKRLCEDVKFLCQSFGGTVIVNSKYPTFTHNGEKKTGQLAYTLTIRLPKGITPVSSEKHLAKFVEKTKYQPVRFIQSIEDIGMQEAQCIRVAAEDHLYVCDEFIVTHNTPSAVFVISQFLEIGYAKRPILVVPNQTYKQWIAEFKKFAGHIRINEFYNMSESFIDDWKDVNGATKMVPEGSVSIITYEGMEKLGFNETTIQTLVPSVGAILLQKTDEGATSKKRDREAEKLNSQIEKIIGTALSHTAVFIEELGFDFISFDEAHACKKVFTSVAGEKEENLGNSGKETQAVSRYKIQSGSPSSRGVKGFMLCQYIQNKYDGNTLLLTATPFTNSPLEIYSMLAMVAHKKLKTDGLDNLTTFFDTFVAISYEMIINSRLKPERRQVIMGFNNLISLQTLVRRFMNYKTGEEVNVPRPNKIVLPLRTKMLNGLKVELGDDERVETILPLSPEQLELMAGIKRYANGEVDEATMCSGALIDDEDEDVARAEGVEIDEEVMTKDEKVGVRLLKAMNHARNLALSPYIFSCSGLGTPTYDKYINTSNKLKYVMESVRTIKEYHEKEGTDMSGVVIYMDRGVEYFKLIREYLIKEVGFAEHEVGIISSKLITPVPAGIKQEDKKEYVKNLFLGERFNTSTLEMEKLSGKERCKVMIGSSTIKEGINLQKHSSVLFNCWMDWNPTDLQQLEGRIYRQGNKFLTVRIVNPLMIDSMDIFMFQKLEEKTSRINTIWANEGRTNVLKTEEFNPKDLKYSLIKDATVLAEMELLEIGEKIGEDIADAENRIKRNEKIQGYARTIANHSKDLAKRLQMYRPLADGQPERPLEAMLRLYQDVLKKQTDALGKKMEYQYQRDKKTEYSSLTPETKQYWFDDLNYANRGMIHEKRGYLVPNGVEVENLSEYSEKIKKEIEGMKAAKESAVSPEAIQIKAQEIHAKREADHIEEKTVGQCIVDFKKLNYLLSHLKGAEVVVEEKLGPPLDADGKVRVDEEGIILLERAVEQDADTKLLHTDLEGNYTPERQKLHAHIIEDMTSKTVCIDRGRPIAILTGGAPGSGKSTFLNKYAPFLQSDYIWKVDADAVREYLPEYEGWNSQSTHQETRDVVNKLITTFDTPCKHDLLYDGTMSNSQKYIDLIGRLKRIGYLVYIVYMDVPEEVSKQRALSRFVNNKGGKTKFGRYVPSRVINDFFKTGKQGLDEIKTSVDGYIVVDSLTQKITEKGGEKIPSDRNYAEMFDMKEQSELEQAIGMLNELLPDLEGAQLIECKEAIEMLKELLPEQMGKGGTVFTKDGVEVEKGSDKYKDHVFYDEKGVGYKCLGYFPKLDDCVYINQNTGDEVVGCMDGFFYDKPMCCGGPVTQEFGKGGGIGEGVRVGDLISNAGKFGNRVVEIQGDMVYADGGYSVNKKDLKLINSDGKLVPENEWNEESDHNYWEAKSFSYYKHGGPITTTNDLVGKKYLNNTNNVTVVVYNVDKDNWVYLHVAGEKQSYANSTMYSPDDFDRYVRNGVYTPLEEKSLGGAIGTITEADITAGAKFKNRHGQVFIIDSLDKDDKFGVLVKSSLEGGAKGNYRDSLTDLVAFLNEEGSVKIMAEGGYVTNKTHRYFVFNHSTKKVESGFENKQDAIDFKNDMQFPDDYVVLSERGLKLKNVVENQYIGNTPAEIWSKWNKAQKAHFLSDHAQTLFGRTQDKFTKKNHAELKKYVSQANYHELPLIVQMLVADHAETGQYGLGGLIDAEIAKHKADPNYDEYGEEMNKVFGEYGELTEEDEEYLLKATPIEALEYLKKHIKK